MLATKALHSYVDKADNFVDIEVRGGGICPCIYARKNELNKFCVRWMVANFQLIDAVFENHKRINEYKMSDKMIWVAFVDALKKFLV